MKAELKLLHPIFLRLSPRPNEPFTLPGLYELIMQVILIQECLSDSSTVYPEDFAVVEFPDAPDPSHIQAVFILQGIQGVSELLPEAQPIIEEEFREAVSAISEPLNIWCNKVIESLQTYSAIHRAKIPRDTCIVLLRTICFLYKYTETEIQPSVNGLYAQACITFGLMAIHRYSKSVFWKIGKTLIVETANMGEDYRSFVSWVEKMLALWCRVSSLMLPVFIAEVSFPHPFPRCLN